MLNANLKMFDQDYIEALIAQLLPNAKVNDIVPLQAVVRFDTNLSPDPTNDYQLFTTQTQSRLFFGHVSFFGSILPYLILPTPSGVVESFQTERLNDMNGNEVTAYSSPMPVLFQTLLASFGGDVAKGSFHFIGFQISLDSFIPDTVFEPPVYFPSFNGSFASLVVFLSNDNNNSSGHPRLYVFGFMAGEEPNPDYFIVENPEDDFSEVFDAVSDTVFEVEKPAPFSGVIRVSLYRPEDGSKSDTRVFNIAGDIRPYTFYDWGSTPANGSVHFRISQVCFLQIQFFNAAGVALSELSDFAVGATDVLTVSVPWLSGVDRLTASYVMVRVQQDGYECPFLFKQSLAG